MNYLGHALPIVLSVLALGSSGQAQQDQTSGDLTSPPVNARYLQGVGTGYWPTVPATPTFTLNIAKGTAFCNGQAVTYSGGSLTMAAAAATPAAPSLSQVSGGVLPATTYYVKVTYVNASGETLPSAESNLYVYDYNRLQVASPAASGNATGWNVYVSDASTGPGTERMQNSGGPVAIGAFWTELPRGLVSGPWPPSTNTANNTNYVYLDPAASCAPASNVTGFLPGHVPIAKVCSDTTTIYACTEGAPLLTDVRNWFVPQPCLMSSSGAVNCAALGTDRDITLTPSGTGSTAGSVITAKLDNIRYIDGSKYSRTSAGINSALGDLGSNGTIVLTPGFYDITSGSTINNRGVRLRGSGMDSTILQVSATEDVFTVTAQNGLFELSDVSIVITATSGRTGTSIINAQAPEGLVRNVRVVGKNGINNGRIFTQTDAAAGKWWYENVWVPAGTGTLTWDYFLKFGGVSGGTVSGTSLQQVLVDNKFHWNEGGIILDSGVDTFVATNSMLPRWVVENTSGGSAPRWIRCYACFGEGTEDSGTTVANTYLDLQAVRDFRYQGSIASSQKGAVIGAGASDVDISHTIFVNIDREAVNISNGAQGTTLADNTFESTGIEATLKGTERGATLDRDASNNVSATLSGHSLSVGDYIVVSACADTSYNGGPTSTGGTAFKVATTPDGDHFTYNQGGGGYAPETTGCTVAKTAQYYSISVTAGATAFSIRGNKFRDISTSKARYNVVIATGGSDSFEVTENQFGTPAIGYLNNGATGASWTVLGNSPASGTLLDVAGSVGRFQVSSSGAALAFTRGYANYLQAATSGGYLDFVVNGSATSDANASLKLATNGDAYFPLGKVGIGTTSPGQKLDVAGSIGSAVNTVTPSSSNPPACDPMTFDASLGNTQKTTLTCNATSTTLSSASAGEQINFLVCQDGTGSRTFAWPSNVKGGMTIGSTASKCSAQSFIYDGANAYALSPGVTNM